MARANKLYITATDPYAGSSIITLGVLGAMKQRTDKVGFFKPVVRGVGNTDAILMKSAYNLDASPEQMCAMSIGEARELMARHGEDTMLDRICTSYDVIRGTSDLAVLQGINYRRSLSVFDMDINAAIAARLDAPIVLVAGASADGNALDVREVTTSVLTALASFEEKGCDMIGVIVNRVPAESFESDKQKYVEALENEGVTIFGVLPDLEYLGMPRLKRVVSSLDATVLAGDEMLGNIVAKTVVAAMAPRNFLKWIQADNTLVVSPGDRDDVLTTMALMQKSSRHRRIAGLLLTGGLDPDPSIMDLVTEGGVKFPILSVKDDTFSTITKIRGMRVRIDPGDQDKIMAATAAVGKYVDQSMLWERLEFSESRPARAGSFLENVVSTATKYHRTIVFPEGDEPRTVRAVARLAQGKVLQPVLVGNHDVIASVAETEGVSLDGVRVVDPQSDEKRDAYAKLVFELRKNKRGGMTIETASQWLDQSPINYGMAMLKYGDADGLVAGAVHSTGDTIRPAFQIIGTRPEVGLASSVFFMVFKDRVLVYGDCAVIPSPNMNELASIAIAGAHTARTFGIEPRVAMLSYSTGSSGSGGDVDKVTEATQIVREREPFLAVDGPMQYDAAIDPEVAKSKQPDSPVAGQATVFIFPSLDAGNIAYKAVQRMSGALAVGPIMQGMGKPVNDLSRGCSVDDIYYVGAITAVQAGSGVPAGQADRSDQSSDSKSDCKETEPVLVAAGA